LHRLSSFKKNRHKDTVQNSLNNLTTAIRDENNLVPHVVSCIKSKCTLGEICDTMKKEFGEYI
jgi:methylmalonyl-CoA mutase N-terminal domain/subunit